MRSIRPMKPTGAVPGSGMVRAHTGVVPEGDAAVQDVDRQVLDVGLDGVEEVLRLPGTGAGKTVEHDGHGRFPFWRGGRSDLGEHRSRRHRRVWAEAPQAVSSRAWTER